MDETDAKLSVIAGANQGYELPLRGEPILVGRGPDCDLTLRDNYASRHHCWIEPREDRWWVRDLGSKNGTLVGTERVEHEQRLYDGEIITVGRTQIRFSDPASTKTYRALPDTTRLVLDIPSRTVQVDGIVVDPPLSPKQWALLTLLWERRGEAVSKDTIARRVWPEAEGSIYDYQIDKLVSRLRARLGKSGEELIETVWGFGYQLKGDSSA
ncbi:MAG: FHA domain-containing protein [Chloroflexota bacterium]|nr:FHA domain-containing protein [Chloroflexota bacterium]